MKKKILLFVVTAFLVTGFISCKKSSGSTNTPSAAFTYTVDGTNVTADSVQALLYTTGVPAHREIDLYVFKGGTTAMPNQVFEMHFLPQSGTQTVGTVLSTTAWLTYSNYVSGNPLPTESYDGTSGSFNMSVCDTVSKKLTGTFNFTGAAVIGAGTKTITNGNFSVTKITVQ
jgi:hypothetical protein